MARGVGTVLDVAIPAFHVAIDIERPWQYLQTPNSVESTSRDGLTVMWQKVLERQGWKVASVAFSAWPTVYDSQLSYLRYRVPFKWLDTRKNVTSTITQEDLDEL